MRAFILALSLSLTSLFGLVAIPASAQVTQQQINTGLCNGANFDFSPGASTSCQGSQGQTINNIVRKIINLLSLIVGFVAVIMIIVGGFRYITSGGNDTSVTGAKNTILYAVIGLVIVALSQIIVHFVLNNLSSATQ